MFRSTSYRYWLPTIAGALALAWLPIAGESECLARIRPRANSVRTSPAPAAPAPAVPAPTVDTSEEFKEVMSRGKSHLELRQYEEAYKYFTRAIQLNPKDGNAYLLRSRTSCATKKLDNELADLRRGVELLPDEHAARVHLVNLLIGKQAYDQVQVEAEKVLKADPSNVEAARWEIASRIIMDCRQKGRKASSQDYRVYFLNSRYFQTGEELLKQGNLSGAMGCFSRDLALRGGIGGDGLGSLPTVAKRAEIYFLKEQPDRAFQEYKGLLSSRKFYLRDESEFHSFLEPWRKRGDLARVTDLITVLIDNPANRSHNWLRVARARSYEDAKNFTKAEEDFATLAKLSPRDPFAYLPLADFYTRRGRRDDAIKELEIAIQLARTNKDHRALTSAYLARGSIWETANEPFKAQADFAAALEYNPTSVPAMRGKQRVAAATRETGGSESLEDLKKTLREFEQELSRR